MTLTVHRCLLKELLHKADMTQVELAEYLGVKPQQIQHYVQNHRVMSLVVAKNISIILGCNIDDLYDWRKKSRLKRVELACLLLTIPISQRTYSNNTI